MIKIFNIKIECCWLKEYEPKCNIKNKEKKKFIFYEFTWVKDQPLFN